MRDTARAALDQAGGLEIGRGTMDAYMFGYGDDSSAHVGAAVEYSHNLSEALSLFGRGSAGYYTGPLYDDNRQGFGWDVQAGARFRF